MGENDWPGGYRAFRLAVVALASRTSVLPWQSRRAQGGVGQVRRSWLGSGKGGRGAGRLAFLGAAALHTSVP